MPKPIREMLYSIVTRLRDNNDEADYINIDFDHIAGYSVDLTLRKVTYSRQPEIVNHDD